MAYALIVTGEEACFRRPEMTVDRVTYDVITPMAARGIFESVHWTPAIFWRVTSIEVMHPIRTFWSKVLGEAPSARTGYGEPPLQSLHLMNVCYLLHARFEMTDLAGPADSAAQHAHMFRRRAKARRFFRAPYLGHRDLAAEVRVADGGDQIVSCYRDVDEVDLGWMLFDRDHDNSARQRFFRALMKRGVIDLSDIRATTLPR